MYCKIQNSQVVAYPYDPKKLRKENPNVGFPAHMSNAFLANYGVYPVKADNDPAFNKQTQKISKATTPSLVSGEWRITKTVVDLTADEITALNDAQANEMRVVRDRKLASTDWTQFNDSPLDNTAKQSWATYRQALRDITDHANWPNVENDWPTKP